MSNTSLIPEPIIGAGDTIVGLLRPSTAFSNNIVKAVGPNTINAEVGNPSQDVYSKHGHTKNPITFDNGNGTFTQVLVEDGDTVTQKVVDSNGTVIGTPQVHRINYIDATELGQHPLAASQSYTLEKALRYVQQSGGSVEFQPTGKEVKRNKDKEPRSLTDIYLVSQDDDKVNYSKLAAQEGWVAVAPNSRRQPDNDPYASYTTIWTTGEQARLAGRGVWSGENVAVDNIVQLNKKSKHAPLSTNTKTGSFNYDLEKEENKDKVKIGDVWLDIPPTHISINQLRSSYNIPLLGFEAKPITASLTNRIIIKMNLVFAGSGSINTDLIRIIQQFKLCPINIVRSRDIFEKLSSEATWLKAAYGNTGSYCVPVTMDQFTLYTLESHPGSIGMSLQLSLFNFAAYFHADPNEKIQYYKFDPDLYEITKDRIVLKASTKGRSVFSTTFDLEDSIHPYNFIIENKINKNFKFGNKTGQEGSGSSVAMAKINRTITEKEFDLLAGDKGREIDDVLASLVLGKDGKPVFIIDTAHSISITYSNNFAWQPLVGYAQPVAQYIGPGETQVSINVKTNNQDSISGYLKTYAELIDPSFYGYYDDRYYVDAELLNFVDANVLSVQNVSVNNLESKPGWFDVNLMFNKSSYSTIIGNGNLPQDRDMYWGLGKMFNFLDIKGIRERLQKVERLSNANKATTALYRIPNPLGKDVDGLELSFKSAVNEVLEYLEKNWTALKPSGKTRQDFVGVAQQGEVNAAIASWGSTPIERMTIAQGKLRESEVKDAWTWKALEERANLAKQFGVTVFNLKDSDSVAAGELKKRLFYNAMSKTTKATVDSAISSSNQGLASVYDGRTIAIDFMANDQKEIDAIKKTITDTFKDLKLECKVMDLSDAKYKRLVITRPAGKYYNRVPSEYKQDLSGVFKQMDPKEKDNIEKLLRTAEIKNKPFAAHRYMEDIDDYLCNNILGSKTMGYWFASDKVKNLNNHISNIIAHMDKVQDIVQDYPAWKNVFVKETVNGKVTEKINGLIDKDNPFSILKVAAYPELKKNTMMYVKADGDKSNKLPIDRGIIEVENPDAIKGQEQSDVVFSSFSSQIFNRDYLGAGAELKTYTSAQIKNEESKEMYKIAAGVDGLFKDHWSANNGYKGIIPEGQEILISRNGATPYDISNGFIGDKQNVADPVPVNSGARKVQGTMLSIQSSATGVTYAGEIKKEAPAAVSTPAQPVTRETLSQRQKASFGNYATARKSAAYAGDHSPYKDGVTQNTNAEKASEVKKATEAELLKSHMHSMLPTFGIQNAFPTFKMYIIHDNTSEYKYKSLDDYWDYRLVQDMMIIRDKNNPSHILKARVLVDQRYSSVTPKVNQRTDTRDQPLEGRMVGPDSVTDYRMVGNRDPIRQGMRIAIRLGYHTDPRAMDTVFIGTITNLSGTQENGIYNLEARGDGRELLVPASIKDYSLQGENFGDLINMMLRSNPNVVHFGKVYGSFLERFTREHQEWVKFLGQNFLSVPLYAGAAMAPLFMNPITGGLAMTLGLTLGAWAGDSRSANNLIEKGLYNWEKLDLGPLGSNLVSRKVNDLKARLQGQIFNSDKAGYQVAKHMHDTLQFGHNPIDDNIFAVDIWAQGQGHSINMKVNNQKSIWDVLTNIKRMYPGWALDVRPYGNRSTLFLGPPQYNYWRTDDPLLAMAPSLIEKDVVKEIGANKDLIKARNDAMLKLVARDRFNNRTISQPGSQAGENVAPFIPFTKHHSVSSAEDIIYNGIRCTPERGWNSVVVTKENNSEPEEFLANESVYKSAIRRKIEVVDWTSDDRLRTQYAVGLLKEGVEKLYGGILIIRGNPKIEPYDRIQIVDTINRMFGTIEVETVIHKYDSEMGFTTHIVPNMVCSINESSYLTTGDITKRIAVDKFRNMDMGSLAENVAMTVGGFALGFWPMMAAFTTYELAKMLFQKNGGETLPQMISTAMDANKRFKPSNLDDIGWAMKAREFSFNTNVDMIETGIGVGIRKLYDLSKTGKLDLKDVTAKAMTSRFKSMAKSTVESVKSVGGETVTETGKNIGKKSIASFKKLLGKEIPKDAAKAAGVEVAETKMLKRLSRYLPKAKTIGALAIFTVMEGLPMIFEAYAFKAATKGQIISVRPLWHRDSLLMQGLEGYKNSDIWMHTKDVLVNAGEVMAEGWDSFKNFDQNILVNNQLDDRIGGFGEAAASTGGSTGFLHHESIFGADNVLESKAILPEQMELNGTKRFIRNRNPRAYSDDIIKFASASANEAGIPFDLLIATIATESEFKPSAYNKNPGSPDNFDWGICQINYSAHKSSFFKAYGVDLNHPEKYIAHSIKYAAGLLASGYDKLKRENPTMSEDELYRRTYWAYNGGNTMAGYKRKDVAIHGNNFIKNLNSLRNEVARG